MQENESLKKIETNGTQEGSSTEGEENGNGIEDEVEEKKRSESASEIASSDGGETAVGSQESEHSANIRKSSRIKSINKKRKKEAFLEGAEESDFYPMTKIAETSSDISVAKRITGGLQSQLEHISCLEDSVEDRPLKWLVHHEKLLDLDKWVKKLSGGKKDLHGWRYEVYYKQKEGDRKYGLLDTYFVSNKDKKMRTRREVAYHFNLNLSNRSELSRAEVFKYAFHKNLDKLQVHRFPVFLPSQVEVEEISDDGDLDDNTTVTEDSDLENIEMGFLNNEEIQGIDALQKAGRKKLKKKDLKGKSYTITIKNPDNETNGYYQYFLNDKNEFLEGDAYVIYDLQGKPIKGCDVTLNGELEFDGTVITSVGHVLNEKAFHGDEIIYPVGFKSKCKFLSRRTFIDEVFYTNEIRENLKKCWKNGGKKKKCGPIFMVTDDVGNVFKGNSLTDVWRKVITSFMKAFNQKCKRIGFISESLYGSKKNSKLMSKEESIKRKVRHILTGMVTRIYNKQQKLDQSGEDTFDEFDIDLANFEKTKQAILGATSTADSDDENETNKGEIAEESWWDCNVEYTLRGDLGPFLFGLDRLEVRSILEGLPGVSACCQKYVFIVQRDSYKKSFNVKATKKIASNHSRLLRGFAKIRKHLENVEKRSEAANKRFMRLEDDIKQRKSDKEFDDENYKSFMQLVNDKFKADSESKAEEKKILSPTEIKQMEALDKTKLMVTTISLLSRNLGEFTTLKSLSSLEDDSTYFKDLQKSTDEFSNLFKEITAPVECFQTIDKTYSFLALFHFINLFGAFLGLCPEERCTPGVVADNVPESVIKEITEEAAEDIQRNTQLFAADENKRSQYRKTKMKERDDLLRRRKKPIKTENESDEKQKEGEAANVEEVNEEEEEDVDEGEEVEEEEEEEDEEEEEEEDTQVETTTEKNTSETTNKKFEGNGLVLTLTSGKKANKMVLVESIPQRPALLLTEFKNYFFTDDLTLVLPLVTKLLGLIFADYRQVSSDSSDFGRSDPEPSQQWDDGVINFRRVPVTEYTWEEVVRFVLVMFSSLKKKVKLLDGISYTNESEDLILRPSLAYSNKILKAYEVQMLKAKNFNISGRRRSNQKNLTPRQLQAQNEIDLQFELRNNVGRAIDARIEAFNVSERMLDPQSGARTPRGMGNRRSSKAKGKYLGLQYLEKMSEEEEFSLPYWALKLLSVRDLKQTRILRMKKIVSEVVVDIKDYGMSNLPILPDLEKLIEENAVSLKENILKLVESFIKARNCDLTLMNDIERARARLIVRLLASDDVAIAFCSPVDLQLFEDYGEIVKRPMDLQTVDFNLKSNIYVNLEEYLIDMRRVWSNCKKYNPKSSDISKVGQGLWEKFEKYVLGILVQPMHKRKREIDDSVLNQLMLECSAIGVTMKMIMDPRKSVLPEAPWEKDPKPEMIRLVTSTTQRPLIIPADYEEEEVEGFDYHAHDKNEALENDVIVENGSKPSLSASKRGRPKKTLVTEMETDDEKTQTLGSRPITPVSTTDDRAKLERLLSGLPSCGSEAPLNFEKYLGSVGIMANEEGLLMRGVCESLEGSTFTVLFPKQKERRTMSVDELIVFQRQAAEKEFEYYWQTNEEFYKEDMAEPPAENSMLLDLSSKLLYCSYSDLSSEERLALLQFLIEQAGDSLSLREEFDRRFDLLIQTRKKWRFNPPVVRFRHPKNFKVPAKESEVECPWIGCYPGPKTTDSLTDEVTVQLNKVNDELWNIINDDSIPLNRTLETGYNRVERELARCFKKNKRKHEEKLWKVELELLLQRYQCRLRCLGRDRFFNKYFVFPGDHKRLFIQPFCSSIEEFKVDASNVLNQWAVISGREKLSKLVAVLSGKTKREGALRFAIRRRLTIFERQGDYDVNLGEEVDFKISRIGQSLQDLEKQDDAVKSDTFKDILWKCKSSMILSEEEVEEHVELCKKASLTIGCSRETSAGRALFSCKIIMLNIEKIFCEARKLKGNLRGWFDGKRLGWIRFLLVASSPEELRQALFFLEDKLEKEKIEVAAWYENCYADCSLAIRCQTYSSICCRVLALDESLNYNSLGKKKYRKRPNKGPGSSVNKRKKT